MASFIESTRKEKAPANPTVPRKPAFLKLPYVNKKCEDYAKRLKKLVSDNYWQTDFNVAFETPMNVGKMFPYKDTVNNVLDRSLVVYNLKCNKCEAQYIGKTERILSYRIKEHRINSSSACKQHEKSNRDHLIDYDNVEIIDSADTDHKLRIKELLHIQGDLFTSDTF